MKTYEDEYYSTPISKPNHYNKIILSLASLIILWGGCIILQYVFQSSLGKYSVYNPKEAHRILKIVFPVPTTIQYIETNNTLPTSISYKIKLYSGGVIETKNIQMDGDTVVFKDSGGITVSIKRGEIESMTKQSNY